jgi:hypothetical protein
MSRSSTFTLNLSNYQRCEWPSDDGGDDGGDGDGCCLSHCC